MTAGIYVHIPFCRQRCHYCTFYSTTGSVPDSETYLRALEKHLDILTKGEMFSASIDTVYFGGGTPSIMAPSFFARTLELISQRVPVSPQLEVTVELNPESVDEAYLTELQVCGVNRVSIGAQSFESTVLNRIGRCHTVEQTRAVIEWVSRRFDNVSVDLMIGVAGSTGRMENLIPSDVLAHIQHVSVYMMEGEKSRSLQADPDLAADRYLSLCEHLERHGFDQYEISNFSRPGFRSRHNCHYWNGDPYLGLGPGAHSFFDGVRIACECGLNAFLDGEFSQVRTPYCGEAFSRELVMLRLRTREGIELKNLEKAFQTRIRSELEGLCREFPELIMPVNGGFRLTRKGMLLSNELFERIVFP